ncbi:DUF5777 family beta-barrel protein [Catalinimonas niigatensis]|uniref:DUF5777 family beta-barrel protein n=1 Tax=Catalinimonas niigatensis TaxID=1397264 RepID=UPI0026662BB8|nr:DUF5777 family beta-barrel protein [Catalinimonas niigatensis]WPP49334.1 DUF5777 family beta-barrel protein [Catalinimonas niigatensis]
MFSKILMTLCLALGLGEYILAQGLLDELENEQDSVQQVADATFKGTRLINGHSVETDGEGELNFIISHRFGRINGGAYEFFGLDESNVRLALEYGLTDRLNIGIGRSSFEKVIDGFVKYRLLQQQSGAQEIPLSITAFSSMAINTLRNENPERELQFKSRVDYTYQLLMARKFSSNLSLQLMPTLVHRNLVMTADQDNNLFALGVGGRYKLTKRVALNLEYYYRLNADAEENFYYNPLAIGFDIETGGHVFQLHFTNARSMIEEGFITESTGNFFSGDIHFGFNISRVFQLK